MSTTPAAAYTPLESLLLFQSLAAYGTDRDAFIRISDLLTTNVLVREDDAYDPTRLSSDALQELYLNLVNDDSRNQTPEGDTNGDATSSKKRKLQSPPLPTIQGAKNDQLPRLVDRLYGRYREYMMRLIHEDEQQYETLMTEIEEIARGDWDDRILNDGRTMVNRKATLEESIPKKGPGKSVRPGHSLSNADAEIAGLSPAPKVVLRQTKLQFPSSALVPNDAPASTPPPSVTPLPQDEVRPDSFPITDVPINQYAPPSSAMILEATTNVQYGSQVSPQPPSDHQRTSIADRSHGPSPLQPSQQRPPDSWKWEQYQAGPTQPPPPYPPNYAQFSPPPYPLQYPPYPPPQRGSFSGQPGHGPPPPHARLPSSPLNPAHPTPGVPLPPNGARGPGSPPAPHLDQLANAAEQQYRAASGSPMIQQGPMSGSPYGHPYPAYPPPPAQYSHGRPSPGNGASQWSPHYPPQPYHPPQNYAYPPPTQNGQRPFVPGPDVLQNQPRQYNSPYNAGHGARPIQPSSASTTPRLRPSRDSGIRPHTPTSFGRIFQTGRATIWTPVASPSTPKAPTTLEQAEHGPAYEPLSPVLGPSKSTGKGSARKNELSLTKRGGRGGRGGQRGRAGSAVVASSAIGRSHRSPSTSSRPDDFITEKDSIRKVKQESSTPRLIDETGDTTADEGPSRRRGAIPDYTAQRLKRKRGPSPEPIARSSGPPTHISWTRNFPKISASALERIGAHRNASTFALPIKERDAPGYKTLILRPQDLKSIRSSVVAGSKAAATIAATLEDQGAPIVTLPISIDLIPPKGIVNNSQLEKELMLMFANAIMFNPDPSRGVGKAFEALQSVEDGAADGAAASKYDFDENGIIKDTTAMFADVEKIMRDLRSAEVRDEDRTAASEMEGEGNETDEISGGGEVVKHGGSLAKRRKRA